MKRQAVKFNWMYLDIGSKTEAFWNIQFLYRLSFLKVLLRIYGRTHGEQALETVLTDTVVFTLLSERKLGPKLHGIFPGGRIEQYIPVSTIWTKKKTIENVNDSSFILLSWSSNHVTSLLTRVYCIYLFILLNKGSTFSY